MEFEGNFAEKYNMFTEQAESGVVAYETLSGPMQGEIFDSLMEKVDIKKGSKIIDIGCGTGNNSFKLSKMVGDEGMVMAIDPIKQRIEKAKDAYGYKPNLYFKEGCAEESWKYGTDYDLAVSTTVLHWVSLHKRREAFEGIYKSLKPNSMFVFDVASCQETSLNFVIENMLWYKQFMENYFPLFKEDAEKLLSEVGFRNIKVKKVDICIPFSNLDDYIRWVACSLHVGNYTEILNELRDGCKSKNLTSLYDDKGQIFHKQEYLFAYCQK